MNKKRYIRQTTLKEVGEKGQELLTNTAVIIIGCGGLGGEVAVHLAASGIGKITLIDFDIIDESNLHRQVFFLEKDLGKSKAEVLKDYIKSQNSLINIAAIQTTINKENIAKTIENFPFVIDCTDSLETKFLLNDACVVLDKTFFYASLYKYEGQVAVFNAPISDGTRTANLRDVFSEMPTENIPSCSEVGTLNSIVSIIASFQSNEVLKFILKIGKALSNQLLIYNSLENAQHILKFKAKSTAKIIKNWKEMQEIPPENPNKIDKETFFKRLKQEEIQVISVIEEEREFDFPVHYHFPFSCFDVDDIELPDSEYIILCPYGNASLAAAYMLKRKFINSSFKSLEGGIWDWEI